MELERIGALLTLLFSMATTDRSVAVDDSGLLFGQDAQLEAEADATAISESATVAGIAEATALVTEAAGVLDSTIDAGDTATLDVDETASARAIAETINRSSLVASSGNSGNEATLGDRVLDASTGATLGFIIDAIGTYAATPDGTGIGTLAGGELLAGATAYASFTGNSGGILDRQDQRDDISVGDDALIDVNVANLSEARADNTGGDAYATSDLKESYGLSQIELSAGNDGTLAVQLDADASATAAAVGDPSASSDGSGADARAAAYAREVVGIDDLGSGAGDFVFGDNATIDTRAGRSSDQISIAADAVTETGHAEAIAGSERIAGLQDAQDGDVDTRANVLEVGNDGVVTATGYTDTDASAQTTTGSAIADADLGQVLGLQADDLVVGDNGQVQAQAGSQIDVSATTVNGIEAGSGDAMATADLSETRGLDAETLTIGADALKPDGYGILGRTDAGLTVSASSTGADSAGDEAQAAGRVQDAVGVQLGDGSASAGSRKALSVGANASLAGIAEITNTVSATSVDGRTDAVAFVGNDDGSADQVGAIGVDLSDDAQIGASGTVLAEGSVSMSATASNVGEQGESADAVAAAGADFVAGLDARNGNSNGTGTNSDNPELRFGSGASITAGASADLTASASSIAGAVTAEAGNTSGTAQGLGSGDDLDVVGFASDGLVQSGDSLSLTAKADVDLDASGSSTNGAATALSESGDVIGLLSEDLVAGTMATLSTAADQVNTAKAESIDASATASADAGDNVAFRSTDQMLVGVDADVTGAADLSLDTTATTVGDGSGADVATASSGSIATENIGLDLDGGTTTIGRDGRLVGLALQTTSAEATGTTAAADADVQLGLAVGVDLTGQTVSIGQDAQIGAGAVGSNRAVATTIDGDVDAEILQSRAAGLGDGVGSMLVGGSAEIDADANLSNVAEATSTVADSASARARIDNDVVQAVNLDETGNGLTVGQDLALDADAVSNQQATASTIGSPGGSDQAAEAEVANGDRIIGIANTRIEVGHDVSQFTVSASLDGEAIANNMSGASIAKAGVGTNPAVRGLDDGNGEALQIGGSATNGLRFEAMSNLDAQAITVEDQAEAYAGSETANGSGVAALESDVAALHTSAVKVGGSAGTISATTTSNLTATAQTNGTDSGNQEAIAQVAQEADGLVNSAVSVGYDGNVNASSTLNGQAIASNIGQTETDDDDAIARLTLDANGIEQDRASDDIRVGADGNVSGRSFLDGGATAEAINGAATTTADLDSAGVRLDDADADISIGQAGNITGLSVLGKLTDGTFTDQIDLIATTVAETATVNSRFNGDGVRGTDTDDTAGNQTVLQAGGSAGNITGQALGGGRLVATSTGDASLQGRDSDATATATLQTSELAGLRDVDLFGGQAGANTIKGSSYGDFDTYATSTKGDAIGSADVDAYGIYDANGDGRLRTSGNVQAIATLTNTVIATTVSGNAEASASSDAVGISGYDVEILGGGSLIANATSNSSASSTSVSGRAGS